MTKAPNPRIYAENHRQGGDPGVTSKIGKRVPSSFTILPRTIVQYKNASDGHPPQCSPPRIIISPPQPSGCCKGSQGYRPTGDLIQLGEFFHGYEVCQTCGHAKRVSRAMRESEYEAYAERQEDIQRILNPHLFEEEFPEEEEEDPDDLGNLQG